ncbi:hypothetical protein COJ85_22870 [Bacillus sp. AFS076308]|uniref:hypothetical protein n=1 Tax=unclassified Bacillus (in: firmicutes) TaxID=185979 RepID=UPI000BF32FEC|nr:MULTISPECIES: hypothetical protein [unclassified Bacillus (in: firmicutes)]PFN97213.1 hypothetical protein COJ85_22870 [Bacillus sp. AFS076308]PGV48442.1 hypothetical protein COD92_26505 [Bacillus sp. AFS037270]
MIYPIIKQGDQNHLVKDSYQCLCGLEFNKEKTIKRKTLRKIKFIELGQVTCQKCVLKLLTINKDFTKIVESFGKFFI